MSDVLKHYRQLLGIAKTWALKNIPGWSDDLHRDLIYRHGAVLVNGRVSSTSMTIAQLVAACDDYAKRGWPKTTGAHKNERGETRKVPPRIAHIVRLWGRLDAAGMLQKSTRGALLAFCARQVRRIVRDLDSLSVAECQTVTESLKGWLSRA